MRILIIGTPSSPLETASNLAVSRGHKVTHVVEEDAALTHLRNGRGADLLLIDVESDVRALMQALARERLCVSVVAYGIDADPQAAVAAIHAGAKEFLPLPPDAELIAAVLDLIVEDRGQIIAEDPRTRQILELARQFAPTDASVLITGESGTGKEVLAKFLHEASQRAQASMVAVNCAAIPDNLLESELFGHEKGAFTGAMNRRIGKFEEASGGTLLLDEISEMDLRLQAKLLRAIQEKEIDRLGGSQPVRVDIRLLATSNRNLESEVREGRFREDLYFRLNVLNLHLPPLRERPGDIEALARHFAKKHADANGLSIRKVEAEALAKLKSHAWPGNIRELENCMHRAVVLAQSGVIDDAAIMMSSTGVTADPPVMAAPDFIGRSMADVERELILGTLTHTAGNRTQAARILGISIRTLRNKLKDYADNSTAAPMSAASNPHDHSSYATRAYQRPAYTNLS